MNIKVTINDIEFDLCDRTLDTEYREALAHALVKLGYLSDTPLRLSMGTEEQQQELERVCNKPLKPKQLKNIIEFISAEMKGDFQYGNFKPLMDYYLNLADVLINKDRLRKR